MLTSGKSQSFIQKPVFLLVLMVVAFLPVISMQFFLKNDAFTTYFPPKFFMSESLHDGILPLWNPYINFGLPQYADMNAGYWSPVTWLIAGTIGYSAYSFTLEVMLYVALSGLGMYMLCRNYKMHLSVCVIAGASYMCCGYIVGHMQHFNWVSSAAFIPFCALGYRKLIQDPVLLNVIKAAIFFYLLISSAHPGIIIGGIYYFGAWGIFLWFKSNQEPFARKIYNYFSSHFLLILLLILLCAGLISGYIDILPYFTRIQKPPATEISNPFNIVSYISFMFPFSTTKNDTLFSTDIAMRNGYIGMIMTVFFVVALVRKKTKEQWLHLGLATFFLVVASGGIIGKLLYKFPFLGYVRFPGEYAIFSLFSIIIFASIAFNRFVSGKFARQNIVTLVLNMFIIITGLAFVFGLIMLLKYQDSMVFYTTDFRAHPRQGNILKWFIDNISFYDALVIQSFIQFLVLMLMKKYLLKKQFNKLVYLVAAELAIATLLNMPYTAVGQKPVKYIAEVLSHSPKGIPIPGMQPINSNDTADIQISKMIGPWSFYNKQPGNVSKAPYAIQLFTADNIYLESNTHSFTKPFVFFKSSRGKISFAKYSASTIILNTTTDRIDTLVIQQAVYPHWIAKVDEVTLTPVLTSQVYPQIIIPAGAHQVQYIFNPTLVKAMMLTSLIAFIGSILLWVFISSSPSSLQKRLHP